MGRRRGKNSFRDYRHARNRLRRLGDAVLFCVLAGGMLYLVAHLPEDTVEGSVGIIDGDSLRVDGREIRLLGIDAPEAGQSCRDEADADWPCGRDAARSLRGLTANRNISCTGSAEDKYGRLLARCQAGELDLAAEMTRRGFAVSGARQDFAYSAEERRPATLRRGCGKALSKTRMTGGRHGSRARLFQPR